MAIQKVTVVNDVEISGPFLGAKGEYDRHNYKTDIGEFSRLASRDTPPEFKVGDQLDVLYEVGTGKKGTFNKVLKMTKTTTLGDEGQTPKGFTKKPSKSKGNGLTGSELTNLSKTHLVTSFHGETSDERHLKNISMEVSGLLQALVQNEGLNENTQTHLEELLRIKRETANKVK